MNNWHCTICTDRLVPENCAACKCGHTFHFHCILTWTERADTCPQCRRVKPQPVKLFIDLANEDEDIIQEDAAQLKSLWVDAQKKLETAETGRQDTQRKLEKKTDDLKKVKKKVVDSEASNKALKLQLSHMKDMQDDAQGAIAEATQLRNEVQFYKRIKELVADKKDDIDAIVGQTCSKADGRNNSSQQIASALVCLRHEFEKLKASKENLRSNNSQMKSNVDNLLGQVELATTTIEVLTKKLAKADAVIKDLRGRNTRREERYSDDNSNHDGNGNHTSAFDERLPASRETEKTPHGSSSKKYPVTPLPVPTLDQSAEAFLEGLDVDCDIINDITSICHTNASRNPTSFRLKGGSKRARTATKTSLEEGCVKRGYNGLGGQGRIIVTQGGKGKVKKQSSVRARGHFQLNPRLPTISISP